MVLFVRWWNLSVLLLGWPLLACSSDSSTPAAEPARQEPVAAGESVGQQEVDADQVDRLRALGYADVGEPLQQDEPVGVVLHDPERAGRGLHLLIHSHLCRAELVDMNGQLLHGWSHNPCQRWGNALLLTGGDLLVIGREPYVNNPDEARAARYLERLSFAGKSRWLLRIPVHHDLDLVAADFVQVLTYDLRRIPQIHAKVPTRDNGLALVSLDGQLQSSFSLVDLLLAAGEAFPWQGVKPHKHDGAREVDILHCNVVERMHRPELAERNSLYDLDHVLLCSRHQDRVFMIDAVRHELVWQWGKGEISGPHDATVLENGNILLFDNGLGRGISRVLEVDPLREQVVWEYQADEPDSFYSETRGASQRLANGNTLVTDSDSGRVFEVTADGQLVWDYRTPYLTEMREPSIIVRCRRYENLSNDQLQDRIRAGSELPRVD